jgi:hypothetical protein
MRHPLIGLIGLAVVGCAPKVGKFKDDHFAHEYHTYRIGYAGAGVERIMGPEWEPVNWVPQDGDARWSHKAGTEFTVSRTFDFDADGNQDYFRLEAIRDFDFKHRQHDARLWLQVLPMAADAELSDLSSVAEAYLANELPEAMGAATISGETEPCEVSGLSAMRVEFDAGERKGRLVVIDPGAPEKVGPNNLDARIFYYAVYVAGVNDFAAADDDLAAFLDRLSVGTSKKTIPAEPAPTTCRAPEAAPVETEAPAMEEPEEPEPAPEEPEPSPEPEEAAPEEAAPEEPE